jgi:hypothetical protein
MNSTEVSSLAAHNTTYINVKELSHSAHAVSTPRRNSHPPCDNTCRAHQQPIGYPIRYFVTRAKASKSSQFPVIRRSTGIGSYTSESYYCSYKVATSCVNRCVSWICHIRLSRKKIQENRLHMISTEFLSLAKHTTTAGDAFSSSSRLIFPKRAPTRNITYFCRRAVSVETL